MEEKVHVFDTTLRDGEQSPGCSMTVPEKVRMAAQLVDLGVDILEAGFPIASEGDFMAVRTVAREFPQARVAALARATRVDVERAVAALDGAKNPRLHTFIATSDIHLNFKLKKTRAQVLEDAVRAVELARRYVDDVEFSAEDAMRTDYDFLCQISRAVVDAGASTVNIPDTVGYALPVEVAEYIGHVYRALENRATVSIHCHNDLGLAVANTLAAVQAGARQVEVTINGIGERAGNAALEEFVMALKVRRDRLGLFTGIRTELLYPTSQLLTEIIGVAVQPNKAIVGRNAFAHEAGIHQDGVLKERLTYEIIRPQDVGVPESQIVLGKHSGRHALQRRFEQLGIVLNRSELDAVYKAFTQLADRKKVVLDQDLIELVRAQRSGDGTAEPVAAAVAEPRRRGGTSAGLASQPVAVGYAPAGNAARTRQEDPASNLASPRETAWVEPTARSGGAEVDNVMAAVSLAQERRD
jgi:2-isopropylmalate synthase